MRLVTGLFMLMLAGAVWPRPAQASFDYWCEPSWQLVHREYSCDNIAMLAPGNDTRVNLLLLMQDMRGANAPSKPAPKAEPNALLDWPDFAMQYAPAAASENEEGAYAWGEGSRCRSNEAGAAAFEAAIAAAASVPENERTALAAARRALGPSCTGPSEGAAGVAAAEQQVQSDAGKSFAAYLKGAQAFYDGDYDTAKAQFSRLTGEAQPWLSETARYMLARVEVNRAQLDAFDEYGTLKQDRNIDPKVIDAGEAALQDYLKTYPQGLYAASARGLVRRVYWLGGRSDALAASYVALFAEAPATRMLEDVDLANEVDNKMLMTTALGATTDPSVLAVLDLMKMRDDGGLAQTDLQAQKASFAANPALFDYLLAAHAFYVEHKPETATALIPAEAMPQAFTSLEFSRQMLRGMALEAAKDPAVRDHWMAMLPAAQARLQRAALELALAHHDERNKGLDRVFASDSPVRNATLRETLLVNVADAKVLRRQVQDQTVPQHERDVALFTLLYKELSRGRYTDFVKDLALVPDSAAGEGYYGTYAGSEESPPLGLFIRADKLGDYGCGPIKETAASLAKNPKAAKAQLCLADFLRVNGFDQTLLDTQPPEAELGGTPSLFGGKPYVRQAVYQALIAGAKTPAADKAYALYRAVYCYAPGGNNSCGGEDVPQAQRKAWFRQLKRDYPKSLWAKKLEVYW